VSFDWRSESDAPAPERLTPVDDRLTAAEAVRRTRRGEFLLYEGDFHNAKQLLAAMGRRLNARRARTGERGSAANPVHFARAFAAERAERALEQQTLGRIVVALDRQWALQLRRAPDVSLACRQALGRATHERTVLSLKMLLGMLGAAEWRRKGLDVPGLEGRLMPHWGVYVPTRTDYLQLLEHLSVSGQRLIDLGTGTGVIALMLLQRGARHVTGTDTDERAVACATENAQRLGLSARFTAVRADGYPDERADLAVCNPPWLPAEPKTRIDRAVFDEGSRFLLTFLDGLPAHAKAGALILSNLAELLGLREPGWLDAQFARYRLKLTMKHSLKPTLDRAYDRSDPLYPARSSEVTSLYGLEPQ
jgi:methylase of polypeptide subunit release factors